MYKQYIQSSEDSNKFSLSTLTQSGIKVKVTQLQLRSLYFAQETLPFVLLSFVLLQSHPWHSTNVTTSHFIVYPSILILAPPGGSSFAPLYSFTFLHMFCSGATSSSLFLSLLLGHSYFLCSFSPHLKHRGISSTISCLLTSFTPHCITQLFNTSNLFSIIISLFCSSLLLHFQVRCLNLLYLLYILPSLSSNSVLNLARAHLQLSILFMSWSYWSRGIALCSEQMLCKNKGCIG